LLPLLLLLLLLLLPPLSRAEARAVGGRDARERRELPAAVHAVGGIALHCRLERCEHLLLPFLILYAAQAEPMARSADADAAAGAAKGEQRA
jgi:hypothetical protein